jgi:hypothetical protein
MRRNHIKRCLTDGFVKILRCTPSGCGSGCAVAPQVSYRLVSLWIGGLFIWMMRCDGRLAQCEKDNVGVSADAYLPDSLIMMETV